MHPSTLLTNMTTQIIQTIQFVLMKLSWELISAVLLTIGLFKLFPKCGMNRKYAFMPFYRMYKLAQCADMRTEGRVYVTFSIVTTVLKLVYLVLFGHAETLDRISGTVGVVLMAVAFITFIYGIRIFFGLCRIFGLRKRWVFLMLIALWVPVIIWGWSSRIQVDERVFRRAVAAALSKRIEPILPDGLTVNIKSRNVGNFFNRKCLLRDIHMSIKPGHMVLLLGGSGSGKTTLVNAITGYEKANAKIFLQNEDVYKNFGRLKYEIGFAPQQELIRTNDTVYRTVADSAALRLPVNISKKDRDARVAKVIEDMGLGPVQGNIVAKQSGGQKKRVSIAMEFVSDPFLFVLDEPDSGLDGILAKELMQRLHDISREGRIVIVITHTPDRVADLFDDVIVLAKDADRTGRLAFYGTVEEAKSFFGKDSMEGIVKAVNRIEEGGEGRADDMVEKYTEVCNGQAV